jgi:hypothetical protein
MTVLQKYFRLSLAIPCNRPYRVYSSICVLPEDGNKTNLRNIVITRVLVYHVYE